MYKEMTEKRPTVREVVVEIAYIGGNNKVEIKDVINALYKADKKAGYIKTWVEIDNHDDEYGHIVGSTIVVMGEREYTDKEWVDDLQHTILRVNNDRERVLQSMRYFEGDWHEDMKLLSDKVHELKKALKEKK